MRKPLARPLVLIIDTQQDMLAMYAIALYATGFDVMAATNIDEVAARVRNAQPDVVVTATRSDDDTAELVERLQEEPQLRDVPVVIVGEPKAKPEEYVRRGRVAARLRPRCPPNELAMGLRRVLASTG
jgi:CheY-like chemotaxis protein